MIVEYYPNKEFYGNQTITVDVMNPLELEDVHKQDLETFKPLITELWAEEKYNLRFFHHNRTRALQVEWTVGSHKASYMINVEMVRFAALTTSHLARIIKEQMWSKLNNHITNKDGNS